MTLVADDNVTSILAEFGGDPQQAERIWPSSWGLSRFQTQKTGWLGLSLAASNSSCEGEATEGLGSVSFIVSELAMQPPRRLACGSVSSLSGDTAPLTETALDVASRGLSWNMCRTGGPWLCWFLL